MAKRKSPLASQQRRHKPSKGTPPHPLFADSPWSHSKVSRYTPRMTAPAISPPLAPPATLKKLAKLGITTAADVILHLPLRYEDETHLVSIADAQYGHSVQIEGVVSQVNVQYQPRKRLMVQLEQGGHSIWLRFIHFYPSQQTTCAVGNRLRVVGELRSGYFGDEMVHPKVRAVREHQPLSESLTPVYPTTAGLPQFQLIKQIAQALKTCDLADTLPSAVTEPLGLPGFAASVRLLHQPSPDVAQHLLRERTHPAWRRLKFDELLAQQLSLRIARAIRREQNAPVVRPPRELARKLLENLPFGLTRAQQKVLAEIHADLAEPQVVGAHGEVGGQVAVGGAVVTAAARLVEHQRRAVPALELIDQLQRRRGGDHAVDHRLVLDKKRGGRPPLKFLPASQRGRAEETAVIRRSRACSRCS